MPHHIDKNLIQFLIVMLFFAGGAIVNWLKRKSESEQPPDTTSERKFSPPPRPNRPVTQPAPPANAPRPTPRKVDWEAELRRMLGEPQVDLPPALPPQPRPAAKEPPRAPYVPPTHVPPVIPKPAILVEQSRGLPVELTESTQSYTQASHLDAQVAERLRQTQQQVKHHKMSLQVTEVSPQVKQTLALLRNRQTLRSVIMTSVILGPPKSLGG